ncbi:tetratricopeptide repeat protein [Aquabacterium sp.]|uniref:tetratricopeptide repeat protein n=1 Tax=Aquabacterium sp. TaxID=1872578 RepID=UPI002489D39D|nr:tetratricopeptide repeat protein [Aquabacterium sp.]MDI1348794.1 tetratricopeptide repeat protein [Aquabacterium sp.]
MPRFAALNAPRATLSAAALAAMVMGHAAWAAPVAKPAIPAAAASAPGAEAPEAPRVPEQSSLDGQLFYQLLIAEIQANGGDAGSAYQLYLDAARRHQSGQLYQRAVEIALRARAGEQALSAAKAWRQALPQSRDAAEFTSQILIVLGRPGELAAPLRALIQLTPTPQQPQVLANLPRSLARLSDRQVAAQVIDEATQPWRQPPLEMAEAWAASGEAWLMAKQFTKAMAATRKALALQPNLLTANLLAADMIGQQPDAEAWVKGRVSRADAPPLLRLAYARRLASSQRYEEAATQLDELVKVQPEQTGHWILLAAVRLELRQADAAEAALKQVLARTEPAASTPAQPAPTSSAGNTASAEAASGDIALDKDREQAYLLLAQLDDLRGKRADALQWLELADPRHEKMAVQSQRARLLAQQGKVADARALLRGLPESEPRDAITKAQAEVQLLRDLGQLPEAYKVLEQTSARFPDDHELQYDQAMLAEKLKRFKDMERLLRRVIELAPDNPNAYNALGYSLADRKVQLDEARTLVEKAAELKPADPFITDSLGWVAFRQGRLDDAAKLLREAYTARPDTEIGAHLGEVLWAQGRKDEALRVWRESQARDRDNDTLKETLQRLGASL